HRRVPLAIMSEAATDRAEAILAELAEMDLELARKAHGAAMAAEDPAEVAGHIRNYQRMARSVRQTLAIKARLAEGRVRRLAERPRLPEPSPFGIKRRIRELNPAVCRVIDAFTEREDERESYRDDLIEAFCDLDATIDYTAVPLDAHVADICHVLGLPAGLAARWRDLPAGEGEDSS
ncbi:hypothetical protein, partial [Phenylobacterium sp.]|uniref:hypothetical protein n=1 Tax=Phenylobacterium sp. TaxID=1871053 RepID=UPI0025CD8B3B